MSAARYTQGGAFRVEDVPRPQIAPDEMLLSVRAAGICGTDLKIIANGHRKRCDGQTITLGQEFGGIVEEAVPEVEGFPPGATDGVNPEEQE